MYICIYKYNVNPIIYYHKVPGTIKITYLQFTIILLDMQIVAIYLLFIYFLFIGIYNLYIVQYMIL